MRKFVTRTTALLALVAALFMSAHSSSLVALVPPTDAVITAAEQARDTGAPTRSFFRANCPEIDCPGRLPVSKPVGADAPPPVPPAPPAKPKSCTKIANSIWKGSCPAQPSIAEIKRIAREVLAERGWNSDAQWNCLDKLVYKESSWNPYAENSIHAYGLAQSMPGDKMAKTGPDWGYNPRTQLRWMMGYISGRYGKPCDAWYAWNHQYDRGGHHWY